MPYKEIREDYSLQKNKMSIDGTRSYIHTSSSNCTIENLPIVGESFSVVYPLCVLNSIRALPYHFEADGASDWKYVCSYSTTPNSAYQGDSEFETRYTGGGSIESIKLDNGGSAWYWKTSSGESTASGGKILDQSVYRRTTKGTYSVVVTLPEFGSDFYPGIKSWSTYWSSGILAAIGKLNKTEFAGGGGTTWNVGQVLFSSFDSSPTIDGNGVKVWIVNLNFTYMFSNVNNNQWQYLLNDKASGGNYYQIPVFGTKTPDKFPPDGNPSGEYLYDYADFTSTLNINS